jgi:charged multivesicular body protein 3
MAGAISKSTDVMKAMQDLVKLPEIRQSMFELSREMSKAGLIEEMMEDTLEGLEDDDVEDLADEEVEKVLLEITQGIINNVVIVAAILTIGKLETTNDVPSTLPEGATALEPEVESDEEDEQEMSQRLAQLRS